MRNGYNPNPASESSSQEERLAGWYENFLILCTFAAKNNYGIVCHPSQRIAMQDMMERVFEDERWVVGDLPPLVTATNMAQDEFKYIDKQTMNVVSFQAAMQSKTGFGRFSKVYTPGEALNRDRADLN
jgi:hypothetical protein